MKYTMYYDLYEKFTKFISGELFRSLKNDELWVINIFGTKDSYVIKKEIFEGTIGFYCFKGMDSIYAVYLLEKAESSDERKALLADRKFFLFLKKPIEDIPYNFKMYNSAAKIPEENECTQFFGSYNDRCKEGCIIEEAYSSVALKIIDFLCSLDVAPVSLLDGYKNEKGIIQLWDQNSWSRIVEKGLNGEVSLAYNLDETDRLFISELSPKLKLTKTQFEIDFNLVNVKHDNNEVRKEIFVSVLSSDNKCLYFDNVDGRSDLATVVVKGLLNSVFKKRCPYVVLFRKRAVYMWTKYICDLMGIKMEFAEHLTSTENFYEDLMGEGVPCQSKIRTIFTEKNDK